MSNSSSNRESSQTHSSDVVHQPEIKVMLSSPQQMALDWLFNGGSITEAAQFAGVCRQTVSRWLHDDQDFRAIYEAWRTETAGVIQGRLTALSEAALDNLSNAIRTQGNLRASEFVLKSLTAGKSR